MNSYVTDEPASARRQAAHEQELAQTKPRLLVMIATDPIGGPGKGLFQFFAHAPKDAFDYVLCNFDVKDHPFGQFIQEAMRLGLNLQLLRQRLTIDPWLIPQAIRVVRQHRINVIQTHAHKANVLGFLIKPICRKPWIAFAHGYIHGGWKVRIYQFLDRTVLPHADRVVTVSESMKELLVRIGVDAHKIVVVHNAIEPPAVDPESAAAVRARHGIAPTRKVIGVIGRLSPEKGQLDFLKALRTTVRQCADLTALIIGDGPDRAMLEQYTAEHGLRDHVVFTGYQERIADYIQALDLLVSPSLTEGLPNAVLEGMSHGIAVLATSVGGVPEIIGADNGVLVPPSQPEILAAKMTELLTDDARRRDIAVKGRESLYPRFSPAHRVQKMVSLYRELVATSRA
jgi:glycosyltransferase involved in cell wall biosynthesis